LHFLPFALYVDQRLATLPVTCCAMLNAADATAGFGEGVALQATTAPLATGRCWPLASSRPRVQAAKPHHRSPSRPRALLKNAKAASATPGEAAAFGCPDCGMPCPTSAHLCHPQPDPRAVPVQ
jgi:hypothetical protein